MKFSHQPAVHQVQGVKANMEGIPRISNMGTNAYEVVHNCEKYVSQDVLAGMSDFKRKS